MPDSKRSDSRGSGIRLVDTASFASLRQEQGYYVDKTGFLERFFHPGAATLFTRPHGFGKSLMLSMLAEFLDLTKDSRELFAGLGISAHEDVCREWMNQYPVVLVSFGNMQGAVTWEEARARMQEAVVTECRRHAYLAASENVCRYDREDLEDWLAGKTGRRSREFPLETLTRALYEQYGRRVVVLVDDYDAPLLQASAHGYYPRMRLFLQNVLSSSLKGNRSVEFGVLTGSLFIVLADLITGFNNVTCQGLPDLWGADAFGLTCSEVETLLHRAGLAHRMEEARALSGRYCAGDNMELFCTRDLMDFVRHACSEPGPDGAEEEDGKGASWLDWLDEEDKTGEDGTEEDGAAPARAHQDGGDVLRWYAPVGCWIRRWGALAACDLARLLAGDTIRCLMDTAFSVEQLEEDEDMFLGLLYRTGLLARQLDDPNRGREAGLGKWMTLVLPNDRARALLVNLVAGWFRDTVHRDEEEELARALWQADADGCAAVLDSVLHRPGCAAADRAEPRAAHNAAVPGLLAGFCLASVCSEDVGPADCGPAYRGPAGAIREQGACTFLSTNYGTLLVVLRDGARALVVSTRHVREAGRNPALLGEQAWAGLETMAALPCTRELCAHPGVTKVVLWSIACVGRDCQARVRVAKHARQVSQVGQISHVGQSSQDR